MLEAASWPRQPSSPFELRHASTDRPFLVNVPGRRFLVIEGAGPRSAEDFALATAILRQVDGRLRGWMRRDVFTGPVQPILEVRSHIPMGLDRQALTELLSSRADLRWTQMLELPHSASIILAHEAIDRVRAEGGRTVPLVHLVMLEEGPSVQLLRIGEDDRIPAIVRLFDAVDALGVNQVGALHELLLTDPSRVPADRSRAIIRLPIIH